MLVDGGVDGPPFMLGTGRVVLGLYLVGKRLRAEIMKGAVYRSTPQCVHLYVCMHT